MQAGCNPQRCACVGQVGSIVQYSCNRGHRLVGQEVRRCQADLTLSGSEPSCVPATCPAPPAPLHGNVTLSRDPLVAGSRATYSCGPGHVMMGEAVRLCRVDGVLSGSAPTCRPVECDKPTEIISNGRMLGTSFTFNSTISYVCDEGYNLEGSAQRVCGADGRWSGSIPVCISVECPRTSIVNGFASSFRREFGTVVTFSCRPRHRLEGPAERTCMANGQWSGEDPVCVKIICPPPLPLDNGLSRQVDDVTLVHFCNEGFRLEGSNSSSCSEQGAWEPDAPSCLRITCPDISAVRLIHGVVIFTENFGDYGSSVQYVCNTGYTLAGASQRECTESGEWAGEAPVCEVVSCPQPGDVLNGDIVGENFTFGAQIRYECQEGHLLVGAASRKCQADGLWDGEKPRCEPVTCPEIDTAAFENGAVTTLSNTFGGQLRYTCHPGFVLRGDALRECTASGEWSGAEPTCVSLECPAPPTVEHGAVVGDDYRMGRSVTYECSMGFQPVGPTVLVCLPNLLWSDEAPRCERVQCPQLPAFPHGTAVGEGRRYGDGILFVCDPGYELIGEFSRSCLANGTWDGEQPECSPVSCGIPPMVEHARAELENGTLFPATMTYVCDAGYEPQGSGLASCLANGSWSVSNLSCQLVTCPAILALYFRDGTIVGENFSYGEVVHFACNPGFRMSGNNATTCLAEGYWSHEVPTCQPVTCPEPPGLFQGTVTVQGYGFNDTATYGCNTGYRLTGESVARCTQSGEWSRELRECLLVTCPAPPDVIAHGRLVGGKLIYIYEDQVQYQCDAGFELVGTGQLTCTADGAFAPSVPSCAKIQCPSPDTPSQGLVEVVNDTLLYSCVPGYELAGLATRRCLATGQWEGVAPVCIPILCPPPLPVPNGIYLGNAFQFGSIVTYSCEPGFTLLGDRNRTCLAHRAWSGAEPTCERVSCGAPRPIEFGTVVGEDFLYNDTVLYECQLGFALVGQAERTCMETGAWSGDDPYCDEIMCEDPPDVINATHAAASPDATFPFGSLVMYTCHIGHVMTGASSLLCQENGTWSQPLPVCPPVTCPPLPEPEHGHVDGDDVTFGGEFTFTCDRGYRLVGSDSLLCMEDGRWDAEVPVCDQVVCPVPDVTHGETVLQGSVYDHNGSNNNEWTFHNGHSIITMHGYFKVDIS